MKAELEAALAQLGPEVSPQEAARILELAQRAVARMHLDGPVGLVFRCGRLDVQADSVLQRLQQRRRLGQGLVDGVGDDVEAPVDFKLPMGAAADERVPGLVGEVAVVAQGGEGDEAAHEIYSSQDSFSAVREALEKSLGAPVSAKLMWRPKTTTPVEGETTKTLIDLIAALEDNDDVQNVYANFEVSDDALAKFAA